MKALKITIIIVIALVLLLFVGVFVASKVINPNDYKPKIEKLVQTNLHRELTIKGNIGWSFFPWLSVRVSNITLSNPNGFTIQKPFLSVQEADVRVRLLPLIFGDIKFGKIILKGATVNLIVAPSGKSNWDDFANKPAQSFSVTKATTKQSKKPKNQIQTAPRKGSQSNNYLNHLNIGAIDVENANLYWTNQQTQQKLTLTNLNLKASNLNLHSTFPIDISFKFNQTKPAINFNLDLKGNIQVNLAKERYALKDLALNGTAYKLFNYLKKPLPILLKGNFVLDLQKQTLSLEKMYAKFSNLVLQGKLDGKNIVQAPAMQGEFNLPAFDARKLLSIFNVTFKTPASSALQTIGGKLKFNFSPKFIKVPTFDLNVDQSHFKGEFDYANFNTPSINFNLTLDKINLDQYLPMKLSFTNAKVARTYVKHTKSLKTAKKTSSTKKSNHPNKQIFSIPFLKKLSLNGQIKTDKIIYHKGIITNFLIKATGSNGKISVNPIQANLYRGKLQSNVTIRVPQSTPFLYVNAKLKNIDASQLIKSKKGKAPINGTLNFSTTLSTSGNTMQTWLNRLNGKGQFSLTGGALNGVNIQSMVNLGQQILKNPSLAKQQSNTSQQSSSQTPFKSLTGHYTVRNSILYNNDLLLSSNYLTVKGEGQVNLAANNMNYRCSAVLGKYSKNAIPIPILITGKITKPKYNLDVPVLLKNIAKQQIKKQLSRVFTNNPVGQQLGKALSGLFGGK